MKSQHDRVNMTTPRSLAHALLRLCAGVHACCALRSAWANGHVADHNSLNDRVHAPSPTLWVRPPHSRHMNEKCIYTNHHHHHRGDRLSSCGHALAPACVLERNPQSPNCQLNLLRSYPRRLLSVCSCGPGEWLPDQHVDGLLYNIHKHGASRGCSGGGGG